MLEKLLLPENHAFTILIRDHDKVKELFDRFEKTDDEQEKEGIITEAVISGRSTCITKPRVLFK